MADAVETRLAVAELREQPEQGPLGYMLIRGDGPFASAMLFLGQGVPRTGLETWLVHADREIYLGGLSPLPGSEALHTQPFTSASLMGAVQVRVTAALAHQPMAGALVWLSEPAVVGFRLEPNPAVPVMGAAQPAPGLGLGFGPDFSRVFNPVFSPVFNPVFSPEFNPVSNPVFSPEFNPVSNPAPSLGPNPDPAIESDPALALGLNPDLALEANPDLVLEAHLALAADPVPALELRTGPALDPAQVHPQVFAPESLAPAAPDTVTTLGVTDRRVWLTSQHLQAPRASGSAVLDPLTGGMLLSLRNLPSPSQLGSDPTTGRPLSAYHAWLSSRRSGRRYPAGQCPRAWGNAYRLQVPAGLPVTEFDTLLVTAGDDPLAPLVLSGPFVGT